MKSMVVLILFYFSGLSANTKIDERMHDIHLCTIEMEWKDQSVEVSIHIFKDDLLNALLKEFGLKDIPESKDKTYAFIEAYITEKMRISQSDNNIVFHLSDVELWQDAFLCKFIIAHVDIDPELIFSIQNEILFELFDDQTNIMQISANGKRKVLTFDRKKPMREIRL
jgi:hypothetical protein